jgi:hypothetical protein
LTGAGLRSYLGCVQEREETGFTRRSRAGAHGKARAERKRNAKRDRRIATLGKQGRSLAEIRDAIAAEYGRLLSREGIRKILTRAA